MFSSPHPSTRGKLNIADVPQALLKIPIPVYLFITGHGTNEVGQVKLSDVECISDSIDGCNCKFPKHDHMFSVGDMLSDLVKGFNAQLPNNMPRPMFAYLSFSGVNFPDGYRPPCPIFYYKNNVDIRSMGDALDLLDLGVFNQNEWEAYESSDAILWDLNEDKRKVSENWISIMKQ